MAKARYFLFGGTTAFVNGRRVDVGEVFEYDEEVQGKPPKFSRKLEEAETPPVPVEPAQPNLTMSEMQVGGATRARASDQEPV